MGFFKQDKAMQLHLKLRYLIKLLVTGTRCYQDKQWNTLSCTTAVCKW